MGGFPVQSRCKRAFGSLLVLASLETRSRVSVVASEVSLEERRTVDVGTLTAMIRDAERARRVQRSTKAAQRLEFFDPFFMGGFYGGVYFLGPTQVDPRRLDTLLDNFDYWETTARASLLLTFARVTSAPGGRFRYDAATGSELDSQKDRDTRDRARILKLVADKRYAADWKLFVKRYKACVRRASTRTREYLAANPKAGFIEVAKDVVDPIARQVGLHDSVESSRIEPEDVANEMLRMVRERMGRERLPEESAQISPDRLFYSCDTAGRGSVGILPWHPLAEAMFRALEAGEEDPEGADIKTAFVRLAEGFNDWLKENRGADSKRRDERIRELATDNALFEKIEKYSTGWGNKANSNNGF